jgi:photosystem II stability/assembly factor-like uncharacterized protein
MPDLILATPSGLFIARGGPSWTIERHLARLRPETVAVDPLDPQRIYVGTWGHGLWRSTDGGRRWERAEGIPHAAVTAVAAAPLERGVVYAGTEPSRIYRSDDGGVTWRELDGLQALPSADSWSFPPRPQTHHVRWIEPDPLAPGRLYVAIEAGALVRTPDGGRTWLDRVRGGPFDTHTAATHRLAPGRVYAAAGDGYFESADGGERWRRRTEGLRHGYAVGVAVDPRDPDVVVLSAAAGPWTAYRPDGAEAYVYRKAGGHFAPAMDGLADPAGTTASRFAVQATPPQAIYAANNHGIFRSDDGGSRWKDLPLPWPADALARGVDALALRPD